MSKADLEVSFLNLDSVKNSADAVGDARTRMLGVVQSVFTFLTS